MGMFRWTEKYAVQVKDSDIRTTMNICGDIVTDEMSQAHSKVVGLGLALPKV